MQFPQFVLYQVEGVQHPLVETMEVEVSGWSLLLVDVTYIV